MSDPCYSYTVSSATADAVAVSTLHLSGEFDLASCDDLRTAVTSLVDARPGGIIIDLAEVTFLDSETVQVLLDGHLLAQQRGLPFRLANAHGVVHRVLAVLGLLDLFQALGTA